MIPLIQYHQCLQLCKVNLVYSFSEWIFFLQAHQPEFLYLLPILGCQLWGTYCDYCCCDPSCFSATNQHFCWSHCIQSYMSCFLVNTLYFLYMHVTLLGRLSVNIVRCAFWYILYYYYYIAMVIWLWLIIAKHQTNRCILVSVVQVKSVD